MASSCQDNHKMAIRPQNCQKVHAFDSLCHILVKLAYELPTSYTIVRTRVNVSYLYQNLEIPSSYILQHVK